jgi:hypothetical protein
MPCTSTVVAPDSAEISPLNGNRLEGKVSEFAKGIILHMFRDLFYMFYKGVNT